MYTRVYRLWRGCAEQYMRVFAPEGMETVRVCPECPDMVREGGEVREAKSPR